MAFIHRSIIRTISGLLAERSVVLVEGPPRCGRSTIARQVAASSSAGALLVDARRREGRAVIADPGGQSAARPIIIDDAGADEAAALVSWAAGPARRQDESGLSARNLDAAPPGASSLGADAYGGADDGSGADEGRDIGGPVRASPSEKRRNGARGSRFLLVGGPFTDAAGNAAGNAAVVEAGPLSLFEVGRASVRALWLRGGYPEAYGAASDEVSFDWLEGYAADLAHGSLADWGLPRNPGMVTSLLEAAAESNGNAFNENAVSRALGVSRPTVSRYLSILHRAGILFSLPALPSGFMRRSAKKDPNSEGGAPDDRLSAGAGGARAIRAPVLYVRDSGLLHGLLGVRSAESLALRPRAAAASWAGFVSAQAREASPPGTRLYRYASADGAVLDLVAVRDGVPVLAAAARRYRPASVERSISYAAKAVMGSDPGRVPGRAPGRVPGRFIVVPDGAERALTGGFSVIGLGAFLERLAGV